MIIKYKKGKLNYFNILDSDLKIFIASMFKKLYCLLTSDMNSDNQAILIYNIMNVL